MSEFRQYPNLRNGWNVKPARKGTDSVNKWIDNLTSRNLFCVEESTNAWNEIMNYVYYQNKNGEYTNDPIDDYNHIIDPLRYVDTYLDLKQGVAGGGIRRAN